MKNKNQLMVLIMGCVILMITSSVLAQDWPQWRGQNRDGKVAGFTAPKEWPATLKQAWKITVGSGDSTPALVGDKLYVFARQGDEEVTLCLNAGDGKELWRNKYTAQAVTGAAARAHPGPRSSPAVAEGKVVTLGVGGVLTCLDVADGKEVWRKDVFPKVVPQFFTSYSPIIVEGMCIAHLGGKGNGAIMAFDLATGNQKWKWAEEGPDYGSPALMTIEGTKQIVTLTEKSVVSIAVADGALLWQIPFPIKGRGYNAATPVIEGQTVIFTGQARGTAAVKIEKQGDSYKANELWSNTELGTQYNTPVLKDGFLFALSDKGNLFCLSAQTGQTTWTDSTRHGNFGSILDVGSVLMVLPNKSELIVYQPNGQEYSEIKRYQVAETPTYAHPIIAGNRLFVKEQDSVAMWIIE